MPGNFTPSTNIVRDTNRNINYIPTANTKQIVNQLVNDFKKGVRAFLLIGSYGTGKSSFLIALQQSLSKNAKYFTANFVQAPSYGFLNIVGEYGSLQQYLKKLFNINKGTDLSKNIFAEIYIRYAKLGKKNPVLVIMVDEFGKFLEYAAKNDTEEELYFIQQFAEFCNNPEYNIILITTIHQSFDTYAYSLSTSQRNEWIKVKGRFREIIFNEPVEQLLFLAAEHTSSANVPDSSQAYINSTLKLLVSSNAFSVNTEFLKDIVLKLAPLEIFAANVLTLALQRYGQNERSLFSFLESTDHTGIQEHIKSDAGFFTVSHVYNYIEYNFFGYIGSKYNPDFSVWKLIRNNLERVETYFEQNKNYYFIIIKTIGLLNLFASTGAKLNREFLEAYLTLNHKIPNPRLFLEDLEKKKIILYRNYSSRYILFEGTDIDIHSELIVASNEVNQITDIVSLLKKNITLPTLLAKEATFKSGTPRLFEFIVSDYPINETPEGEIDGYINLIFNEKLTKREIVGHSKENGEAILYGFYQETDAIRDLLFEIEKVEMVISKHKDDEVAKKELEDILNHNKALLSQKLIDDLFTSEEKVVWIYAGKESLLTNQRMLNHKLTEICSTVYSSTPVFHNELVNKHKISTSIHTAKRNYFKALVNNWDKPRLGFPAEKYPPEKTIFLSLIESNGLTPYLNAENSSAVLLSTNKFDLLWQCSLEFLDTAKESKRKVSEFAQILATKPFKLKQGLIDFWIPTFLFLKREEFALFGETGYIPFISDEVLELVSKYPGKHTIKAFDIVGVKLDIFNSYRAFLSQNHEENISNKGFVETIRPFLTFYKALPEYAKHTNRLSKEAIKLRKAIAEATDPERSFFDDFPTALGYSLDDLLTTPEKLQSFTLSLQDTVRELRTSYYDLTERFEYFITSEIVVGASSYKEYKEALQIRFKNVRPHLLLQRQKVFIQRINSMIEDRNAWLNSICQALTGVTLESLKDEDEIRLYDKFKSMIIDLDSLLELSEIKVDLSSEYILNIKVNDYISGVVDKTIRFPKELTSKMKKTEVSIKKQLTSDKSVNIAVLSTMLKEMLENE